ncbi:hypothetical protein H257_07386 [Aphanomyces astaci]|uniref:Chromo domain-containing protein n=1 Tax=Aphanomyces astaci TaxID=112090 RepID=W4GI54_APHAT|nr:hypothetical protein H257_07386 [Aphanomyces astaci]ETV79352.1 hypothetical protein H257_07386 [Aphanomyces astaci]|eukprot:XP_009831193.1 hypothetical protein H257_07386 [Aphanomyces astaci]
MKIMGVKHFMTTAGRAQSDGATERQNRTLEDALRCQVSYLGHDWSEHLGTIEYAHQGLIQASMGLIPFEVDTGRKLLKMALQNLDKAQPRQKSYYDKKRSKLEFCEDEFVMLANATSPSSMRNHQVINPNAIKLELPKSMKRLHNVFNVDRLKKCPGQTDRFTNRPIPKATPMLLDDSGHEVFIVEELLKQRQFNRKKEYLVKWHGLPEYEATWGLDGTSNMFPISSDWFKICERRYKRRSR